MKIHIPQPCTEDWHSMSVFGNERFCTACKCKVHDLTAFSAEEIKMKYEAAGRKLCGRISASFLAKQYESEQINKNYFHQLKVFFFAALFSFGSSLFHLPDAKAKKLMSKIKEGMIGTESDSLKNFVNIKGCVKDKTTKDEIPFANIVALVNDSIVASASSKIDGTFEIKLDASKYSKITLKVTYIGYESLRIENISIRGNTTLIMDLEESRAVLGGIMDVVEPVMPLIDPFQSGKTINEMDYKRMPK